MKSKRRLIGIIARAYGTAGTFELEESLDDAFSLSGESTVYVGYSENSAAPRRAEVFERRGKKLIGKLSGVDSPEDIEEFLEKAIFADEEDLIFADEKVFVDEIIGCEAIDFESKEKIGVVSEVLNLPAHDVWIVETPGGRKAKIPAVEEFVKEADFAARKIEFKLIPGLLEED